MDVIINSFPMALGQPKGGVALTPFALRDAGLTSAIEQIGHKVLKWSETALPSTCVYDELRAHIVSEASLKIASIAEQSLKKADFTLNIGGDHSVAIGTVAGFLRAHPDGIVIWIDAHGDINTPQTSLSQNIHGMAVAALMGIDDSPLRITPYLAPGKLGMIGIRNLDPSERERLKPMRDRIGTMYDIDRYGLANVVEKVLTAVDPVSDKPLHVSFDIDVVDPQIAAGTGTPAPGGLSYREAHLVLEMLAETNRLKSMDMVEINPLLDVSGETVNLGVKLLCSALGLRIL